MLDLLYKYPIESAATFATILPLVTFTFRMAYRGRTIRFFFIYLLAKLTIELVMFYLASQKIPNLYLGNLLTVVGFFLIAKMFYEKFNGENYKNLTTLCCALFSFVVAMDITRDGFEYTFRYSGMAECILIMLLGLLYLLELIRHPSIDDPLANRFFWICSALLLYFSTCTFIVPTAFYLDRWPMNTHMHVFTILPYVLETMYLSICAVGILICKN